EKRQLLAGRLLDVEGLNGTPHQIRIVAKRFDAAVYQRPLVELYCGEVVRHLREEGSVVGPMDARETHDASFATGTLPQPIAATAMRTAHSREIKPSAAGDTRALLELHPLLVATLPEGAIDVIETGAGFVAH